MQGPNVKRMILEKMSVDAVPAGGGFADAMKFISSKKSIISGARTATEWVKLAIRAVREAPGPNPWTNADDEAIAGELLRAIDEKRKARR